MPYVVAEPCIGCKHTDCVEVCPVGCFYEGPNFLAIHPEECIDCNACVPACELEAIYPADLLPDRWRHYQAINAELARRWKEQGRNITEKTGPLPDAKAWEDKEKSEEDILSWNQVVASSEVTPD